MADGSFDTWLAKKLNSLSLDEEVYLDYIKSILEEGESESEIKESLCDILSGLLENDVVETANEIVKAWENEKAVENVSVNGNSTDNNDNDDNIKKFIEQQQTKFVTDTKKSKNVDYDLKNKLLAQYGEISDGEEGEDESDDDSGPPSSFVNANAQAVTDKIQQEREKSKKEFEEKKVRDKLNRDKEKSKKEDRQDKEKKRTQKGERKAR